MAPTQKPPKSPAKGSKQGPANQSGGSPAKPGKSTKSGAPEKQPSRWGRAAEAAKLLPALWALIQILDHVAKHVPGLLHLQTTTQAASDSLLLQGRAEEVLVQVKRMASELTALESAEWSERHLVECSEFARHVNELADHLRKRAAEASAALKDEQSSRADVSKQRPSDSDTELMELQRRGQELLSSSEAALLASDV